MLYAGYYNLSQAEKSTQSSRRVSQESTSSEKSTSSSSSQRIKSGLKKVLEELRPTTETLTPAGLYSPAMKQGHLFSRKQSTASSTSAKVELTKA
ncbi:hypothetical protein PV04_09434 [Phialophora macrospora]|uniref:Uncharacterized protein n=1 Tax=Phialophora macrospora TaxID=1851006 RepID=A0A0D2CH67_9EURO|nr:hypothetical protein PV04_09434 [Phialophora macrospora]